MSYPSILPELGERPSIAPVVYTSARVFSRAGEPGEIPVAHSWQCELDRPGQFRVAGGKVYGENGSSATATAEDITTSDPTTIVYLIVGVTDGTREVLNATITSGTEVPADTTTEVHIPIVAFRNLGGGSVYLVPIQLQSSDLYLSAGGGGDSVNHPWKVVKGPQEDAEGLREWLITGGDVFGNGGPITVTDNALNIDIGFIWVKITRDSSSREMTTAVIGSGASVPTSDYTDQYRPIAYVDDEASPPVLQLQFQELHVEELMIVANGEFELLSVDAAVRNTYDPPV